MTARLVSTEWLASNLSKVRILDSSWLLPSAGRSAYNEYLAAHLPSALYYDIDKISDTDSSLPHMLPSTDTFSRMIGEMGITNSDHVVLYDSWAVIATAPRALTTFRVFGHDRVSGTFGVIDDEVLDGGLMKWIKEGREVTNEEVKFAPTEYKCVLNGSLVRSHAQIIENLKTGEEQLVDARPAGRYNCTAPEPREGILHCSC